MERLLERPLMAERGQTRPIVPPIVLAEMQWRLMIRGGTTGFGHALMMMGFVACDGAS